MSVTSLSWPSIEIVALDDAEVVFEPWSWNFAIERREEIGRHFSRLQSERSGIWNGRVLLLNRYAIDGRMLRGACFETDYASFCAWRDWKFPDAGVHNIFPAAALRSGAGAYLLGEM